MEKIRKLLSDKANLVIFILTVTAIILGFLILIQNKEKFAGLNFMTETGSNEVKNESVVNNENTEQQQVVLPLPKNLTDEEKEIFNTPGPNSTQEEQMAFQEKVEKLAVQTNELDISECSIAMPLVLELKDGQEIEIVNDDDNDHILSLNASQTYSIKAGESQKVTIDFEHDSGVYGYGCDNSGRAVGFFLVTPETN